MSEITIPEKDIDLEKLGLVNQGLYAIEGELARRYHKVLREVFDLDASEVDNFRVDKRGLSPELCDVFKRKYQEKLEFGENYLNLDSANRFMVVVSPDQKSAPLIAPQTSYENGLFDNVYKTARHTIEDLTTSGVLYGELENGITIFRSSEDLLQLRTVRISLDTLEGISKALTELQSMSDRLGEKNSSGLDNALNNKYIKKMRAIVEKVGNVTSRAISDIFPIKTEVHCFYVEFFEGVRCLRNFKNEDDIRAIFISHNQKKAKGLGGEVLALDIHDTKVLEVLHKYRFLKYDESLIPQRISEVEDEILLAEGIDVVSITPHLKQREILKRKSNLPSSWHELNDLNRVAVNNGSDLEEAIEEKNYETRLKLSAAVSKKEIINHMLAELDPTDPVRIYKFNLRKFRSEFHSLPLNRQRYQAQKILTDMKGGSD